jgi:hypothetical protein
MNMADIQEVRRAIVWNCALLTSHVHGQNTLTARNIVYHVEELLKAMDDFYAGRDEPRDAE